MNKLENWHLLDLLLLVTVLLSLSPFVKADRITNGPSPERFQRFIIRTRSIDPPAQSPEATSVLGVVADVLIDSVATATDTASTNSVGEGQSSVTRMSSVSMLSKGVSATSGSSGFIKSTPKKTISTARESSGVIDTLGKTKRPSLTTITAMAGSRTPSPTLAVKSNLTGSAKNGSASTGEIKIKGSITSSTNNSRKIDLPTSITTSSRTRSILLPTRTRTSNSTMGLSNSSTSSLAASRRTKATTSSTRVLSTKASVRLTLTSVSSPTQTQVRISSSVLRTSNRLLGSESAAKIGTTNASIPSLPATTNVANTAQTSSSVAVTVSLNTSTVSIETSITSSLIQLTPSAEAAPPTPSTLSQSSTSKIVSALTSSPARTIVTSTATTSARAQDTSSQPPPSLSSVSLPSGVTIPPDDITALQVATSLPGSSNFVLPGRQLSVLPIGLGVFGAVAAIALIIAGCMTWERKKYREQFRKRKRLASNRSSSH